MARVMKTLGITLYPRAKCTECTREWLPSSATRSQAKDHAKYARHKVIVETVTRDEYEWQP